MCIRLARSYWQRRSLCWSNGVACVMRMEAADLRTPRARNVALTLPIRGYRGLIISGSRDASEPRSMLRTWEAWNGLPVLAVKYPRSASSREISRSERTLPERVGLHLCLVLLGKLLAESFTW